MTQVTIVTGRSSLELSFNGAVSQILIDGVCVFDDEFMERLKELGQCILKLTSMSATVTEEQQAELLARPIESLDLSDRPYHSLKRAQIVNIRALISKAEWELLNITNFGQKSLDEVINKLASLGLKLNDD